MHNSPTFTVLLTRYEFTILKSLLLLENFSERPQVRMILEQLQLKKTAKQYQKVWRCLQKLSQGGFVYRETKHTTCGCNHSYPVVSWGLTQKAREFMST